MALSKFQQLRMKIFIGILKTDFNESVEKGLEYEKKARIWYKENLEELAEHLEEDYRDVNNFLDDRYGLGSRSLSKAIKEERAELDELESLTN